MRCQKSMETIILGIRKREYNKNRARFDLRTLWKMNVQKRHRMNLVWKMETYPMQD